MSQPFNTYPICRSLFSLHRVLQGTGKRYQKLLRKRMYLLLGLSKGNARVVISASFFFRSATVCNSLINTHARRCN